MCGQEGFDARRCESTTEMKYQGTVKWFSNKKGFGFIAPTSDNAPTKDEIFVHQTAIVTDGAYRTLKVRTSRSRVWDVTYCLPHYNFESPFRAMIFCQDQSAKETSNSCGGEKDDACFSPCCCCCCCCCCCLFHPIQEDAAVSFEVETEADTGKLKAVNVTNTDGSPIVPPPRERRRRNAKPDAAGSGGEDNNNNKKGSSSDEKKNDKPKKSGGRNQRKPRNNKKDEGKAPAAPKEAPFHAALNEDVKKKMEAKGLELGKRTTVDIAVGDARIKLGQGGYAGCAMASAKVGEGTYTCDEKGTVTFTWEKSLEFKDGAWKKGDPSALVASISLADGKAVIG